MISTDDIEDVPHVVIVETPQGIRLAEFEGDSPAKAAHEYAQTVMLQPGFYGRVIVTCRVRTLQPGSYLFAKHKT